MKLLNTVALHLPSGDAAYGWDLRLTSAEVAALLRAKPGTLREICTDAIQGALEQAIAKGSRGIETDARVASGDLETGRGKEAFA